MEVNSVLINWPSFSMYIKKIYKKRVPISSLIDKLVDTDGSLLLVFAN